VPPAQLEQAAQQHLQMRKRTAQQGVPAFARGAWLTVPEARADQAAGQISLRPSAALRAKTQYSMSLWQMCPTVTPRM